MCRVWSFNGWCAVPILGSKNTNGDRALKYYLNNVLPADCLSQMIICGARYFKYVIVRDAHHRMPEYSTQVCPAGYPIMTVLVGSQQPFDEHDQRTIEVIKEGFGLL
jgi:hypothetical protein